MLYYLKAVTLAVIQGITEFLPISSHAHLILFRWFTNWEPLNLSFDVLLHGGSLLSIFFFFHRELLTILREEKRIIWIILLSCIPTFIVGAVGEEFISQYLNTPIVISIMLVVVAFLFLFVENKPTGKRNWEEVTWKDAILIGLAQSLALVPGISRSGITIVTGLFLGLNRSGATKFSFLMSIPALGGALVYELLKNHIKLTLTFPPAALLIGTLVCFIVSYLAIKYLLVYLQKGTFKPFAYYRILLAIVTIILNNER